MSGLSFEAKVHFKTSGHGRKQMAAGTAPADRVPLGRVPRVSRLMALAIRFEGLLARGEVRDYADLARLGHVTRARITQIMNLLNLAPDIQEALLFLPAVTEGREPVKECDVRPITIVAEWASQRMRWRQSSSRNYHP